MEVSHPPIYDQIQSDMASRKLDTRFSWKRFLTWIFSVVLFAAFSSLALSIALGYRITWQGGIVQTSLIEMNGPLSGLPLTVTVNGQAHSDRFPVKLNDLDPGAYKLKLEKDGYNSWEQTVIVQPNQRVAFENIFLTYAKPTITQTSLIASSDQRFINQDKNSIEIKSSNELWVNDQFVTRTSANLYNAQWLPQYKLVTVQSGSNIVVIDPLNGHEQVLITLPTTEVVSYFFEERGRVLTYRTTEAIWRTELFERSGLFNFL